MSADIKDVKDVKDAAELQANLQVESDAVVLEKAKIARFNQAWAVLCQALQNHPALADLLIDPYCELPLLQQKDRGKIGPKEIAHIIEFIKLPDVYDFYYGKINLNLFYCKLGDEGAFAIAKLIAANLKIKAVYLEGNNISDSAAIAIFQALQTNTHLRTLVLSGNDITDDGARKIASLLKGNQTLSTLKLRCKRMSANATNKLLWAIQYSSITEIDLNNICYGEPNYMELSGLKDKVCETNTNRLNDQFQALLKKFLAFKQEQKSILESFPTLSYSKPDEKTNADVKQNQDKPKETQKPKQAKETQAKNLSFEETYQSLVNELQVLRSKGLVMSNGFHGITGTTTEIELDLAYYGSVNYPSPLRQRIIGLETILLKRGPKIPRPDDMFTREALSLLAVFHLVFAEESDKQFESEIDKHLVAAYVTGKFGQNQQSPLMQHIVVQAKTIWMSKQKENSKQEERWSALVKAECQRLDFNTIHLSLDDHTVSMLEKYPRLQKYFHEDTKFITEQALFFARSLPFTDAEILEVCKGLNLLNICTTLSLYDCQITDEQAQLFFNNLKNNQIRSLGFASNRIGNKGAEACARWLLTTNPNCVSLHLKENQIGDSGASALASMLLKNQHLTLLDLRNNTFSDTARLALIEALEQNSSLTTFEFTNSTDLQNPFTLERQFRVNIQLKKNIHLARIGKIKQKIQQLNPKAPSKKQKDNIQTEEKGKKDKIPNPQSRSDRIIELKKQLEAILKDCQEYRSKAELPEGHIKQLEIEAEFSYYSNEDVWLDFQAAIAKPDQKEQQEFLKHLTHIETLAINAMNLNLKRRILSHLFFLCWTEVQKFILQKAKAKIELRCIGEKEKQEFEKLLMITFIYGSLGQQATDEAVTNDVLDLYANLELTGTPVQDLLKRLEVDVYQLKYDSLKQLYLLKCTLLNMKPQLFLPPSQTAASASESPGNPGRGNSSDVKDAKDAMDGIAGIRGLDAEDDDADDDGIYTESPAMLFSNGLNGSNGLSTDAALTQQGVQHQEQQRKPDQSSPN